MKISAYLKIVELSVGGAKVVKGILVVERYTNI